MIDEYNDSVDLLDLEGKRYKISESDYAKSKLALTQKIELRKIDSQMAQEESAAMTELGRASAEDYARSKEIYNQKILNIQKNAEMQKIIAKELDLIETRQLDDSISRQESWAAGWEEAMIRYEEASKKASTQGAAAFENVVGTMNSALAKFVETGKLNFKDLIGTMIKQMLLAKMQAEASGFFSMLAKTALSYFTGGASGASGGSAGSIVGDLFGGMTGHASGGAISSPSIVGENGAELFIPRTPGTIIPNGAWQSQVAGNNGGMTINGNYIANMSAIDTQSGMQFLAKNRDTIWAAYQSANRSVPISR